MGLVRLVGLAGLGPLAEMVRLAAIRGSRTQILLLVDGGPALVCQGGLSRLRAPGGGLEGGVQGIQCFRGVGDGLPRVDRVTGFGVVVGNFNRLQGEGIVESLGQGGEDLAEVPAGDRLAPGPGGERADRPPWRHPSRGTARSRSSGRRGRPYATASPSASSAEHRARARAGATGRYAPSTPVDRRGAVNRASPLETIREAGSWWAAVLEWSTRPC